MITAAGKSFGECLENCKTELSIVSGIAGSCLYATMTVCGWNEEAGCLAEKTGVLTPAGQAKVFGLAAELTSAKLEETYGCPDCADGGASQLNIEFDGAKTSITYEYHNPPDLLLRVDAFTQGLMDALDACTSTDDVTIDDAGCTPRN